ncbi:MAG: hypothetical protein P1V36_03965, partial [Planctomycetota bacterium]|nr:hypothetical protein [Planctomycetota bacterium]
MHAAEAEVGAGPDLLGDLLAELQLQVAPEARVRERHDRDRACVREVRQALRAVAAAGRRQQADRQGQEQAAQQGEAAAAHRPVQAGGGGGGGTRPAVAGTRTTGAGLAG